MVSLQEIAIFDEKFRIDDIELSIFSKDQKFLSTDTLDVIIIII